MASACGSRIAACRSRSSTPRARRAHGTPAPAGDGQLRASMNGRVVAVAVALGQRVAAGRPVVTLEAMKMEHVHAAPIAGTVKALHVAAGDQVAAQPRAWPRSTTQRFSLPRVRAPRPPEPSGHNPRRPPDERHRRRRAARQARPCVLDHDQPAGQAQCDQRRGDRRHPRRLSRRACRCRRARDRAHGRRRQGLLRRRRPAARQGLCVRPREAQSRLRRPDARRAQRHPAQHRAHQRRVHGRRHGPAVHDRHGGGRRPCAVRPARSEGRRVPDAGDEPAAADRAAPPRARMGAQRRAFRCGAGAAGRPA